MMMNYKNIIEFLIISNYENIIGVHQRKIGIKGAHRYKKMVENHCSTCSVLINNQACLTIIKENL